MNFFKKRVKALASALAGLRKGIRTETHLQIQFIAAILVLVAACYFSVSKGEWLVLVLCIGSVIAFELINSAIERLCNHVRPEWHIDIKTIKDMSAAAVLVATVTAFICALFIFVPYVWC